MRGKRKRFSAKYVGTHRPLGIGYESGLEKRFLDQCYAQGIKVERCKTTVPYQDDTGKWRTYSPDFRLVDFDVVVEVKGMWAVRSNHAYVNEKYHAAKAKFKGRYVLITEKELRSDYVARLHRELVGGH